MKVGDLVESIESLTDECQTGLVVKYWEDHSSIEGPSCHAMVLWGHGKVSYSPAGEIEVISESR